MNNRFIRIGNLVIAINHIVDASRDSNGDVEVNNSNPSRWLRLSGQEAETFWTWATSAMNTTTLTVKQESSESTSV